jgi:hypothetical protein
MVESQAGQVGEVLAGEDAVFADVHLASSCLQKSLRRGEEGFARAAARMLLHRDPERLWRRLCVCAFEDFGLADLSVTARVVAVASAKAFRQVNGEDRVLRHLLSLLCALTKDRRLDDLYGVAAAIYVEPAKRAALANRADRHIGPLVHAAYRLIVTCERTIPRRGFRAVSPEACDRELDAFARRGLGDGALIELCSKGVRLSRCLLPLLLPLAIEATEAFGGLGDPKEQSFATAPLIGGVPGYAIDGFTRAGRAVLAELGREEPRVKELLAPLPAARRLDVLHHLMFFAEGSRCSPLIGDPLAQALLEEAVACGARLPQPRAAAAVALMEELLPQVHALRRLHVPLPTPFPFVSPPSKEEHHDE